MVAPRFRHDPARTRAPRANRFLVPVLFALLLLAPIGRLSAQIAVIVNVRNGADDISADRLKRLFLGQATTFSAGDHARPAIHLPSSDKFDQVALGLVKEMVRSRWMAMAFRGEATAVPVEFSSADEVRKFVREHPDAIAYLPASEVDATVKVLRVDGHRPPDSAYLIR